MQSNGIKEKTTVLHKVIRKMMGNRFEITVVSDNKEWALKRIEEAYSEIQRLEILFTTFNENSQTNLINRNAGIAPVKVDEEVYSLIERSIRISNITQGAFDLSYGSIDKRLWNFDKEMKELPDPVTAKSLVRLINYNNIILDPKKQTVFLKEKGMRIGFGGIGKGYAADRAKQVLLENNVHSGIVNAAGDLIAWGNQPDGKPWTIGIADPNSARHPFSSLSISNMAVATSGNYEKFVMIGGKKYSHTIDPITGLPVAGIKSTTIIAPYAELADAMATPVMVMGINAGLHMINQIKGIACILIDDDNRIFKSNNINLQ